MHELSIAHAVIDAAEAAARDAGDPRARVTVVRLRLGVLSGVVRSALTCAFDVAAEGTLVEGAQLHSTEVPASGCCPSCAVEVVLATAHRFRGPTCDAPTPQVCAGQELELTSIELVAPAPEEHEATPQAVGA